MDSLGGYIATLCVGAVGTYLSQFLRPKIKIRYWLAHDFLYRIPNQTPPTQPGPENQDAPIVHGTYQSPSEQTFFALLTQSVTIQNFGRERADWIEIVYRKKPDVFQLYPALNFTEATAPTGEHTIKVESLAPSEWFTVQFLFYTHAPEFLHIRSSAGLASNMPWMLVRKYPAWIYALLRSLIIVGACSTIYWVVKLGTLILRRFAAI